MCLWHCYITYFLPKLFSVMTLLFLLFQEAVRKSDDPLHVKYLQTLVQCLCMLGKVAAAGAIIWLAFYFFIFLDGFKNAAISVLQAGLVIGTSLKYLLVFLDS